MIDEHKKIIGIPEGHKLVRNDFKWLGPDSEKDTECTITKSSML